MLTQKGAGCSGKREICLIQRSSTIARNRPFGRYARTKAGNASPSAARTIIKKYALNTSARRIRPYLPQITESRIVTRTATQHLRGIDRTLRFGAIGLLATAAAWAMRDILLLVFAAVLIACVLRGASNALDRRTGLGPNASLAVVIALLIATIVALVWWRGNDIAEQTMQIADQLRSQVERLWKQMAASPWGSVVAQQLRNAAKSARVGLTGYVPGVASSVLGIGGSAVVIIATAAFLAASPQTYISGGLRLLPVSWRQRGREAAAQIGSTLQLWFIGQLADMVIVATLVGAGLFILDIPLALTLALVAGLFNFVPYVGALAGALPAILVALAQSPNDALWVSVLFFSIQMLEGNVIAPLIQRRTISLAPALTIMSQTILGTLFGILGLVVATPLTAALVTGVRMIYVEGVLEQDEQSDR